MTDSIVPENCVGSSGQIVLTRSSKRDRLTVLNVSNYSVATLLAKIPSTSNEFVRRDYIRKMQRGATCILEGTYVAISGSIRDMTFTISQFKAGIHSRILYLRPF